MERSASRHKHQMVGVAVFFVMVVSICPESHCPEAMNRARAGWSLARQDPYVGKRDRGFALGAAGCRIESAP